MDLCKIKIALLSAYSAAAGCGDSGRPGGEKEVRPCGGIPEAGVDGRCAEYYTAGQQPARRYCGNGSRLLRFPHHSAAPS